MGRTLAMDCEDGILAVDGLGTRPGGRVGRSTQEREWYPATDLHSVGRAPFHRGGTRG
jgi:hypothetical protein